MLWHSEEGGEGGEGEMGVSLAGPLYYLLLIRHFSTEKNTRVCSVWCFFNIFSLGHTSALAGGGERDGRASGW